MLDKDIYLKLKNVAHTEGVKVADYTGKTLQQCKDLCNQNIKCRSFSFGKSGCHLKDKCIKANDTQRVVKGYQTFYKQCDGKFLML